MSAERRLLPTYFNVPDKAYRFGDGSLKRVMPDGSMRNINERGEPVKRRRMSKKERRYLKAAGRTLPR